MKFNPKLFWTLVALTILSIVLAVWARLEDKMILMTIYTVFSFAAIIDIIRYVNKYTKTDYTEEDFRSIISPDHRTIVLTLWIGFYSIPLLLIVVSLFLRIYFSFPLYLIVLGIWLAAVSVTFIVFAPDIVDDMGNDIYRIKKQIQKMNKKGFVQIHREANPYEFHLEDSDPQYIRQFLSCPTCFFDNEESFNHGRPWCDMPDPPDIRKNYCESFRHRE